jgi:hypothetical protein
MVMSSDGPPPLLLPPPVPEPVLAPPPVVVLELLAELVVPPLPSSAAMPSALPSEQPKVKPARRAPARVGKVVERVFTVGMAGLLRLWQKALIVRTKTFYFSTGVTVAVRLLENSER